MFRHITASKHICVFNCKQMFKADKEMFTSTGKLNTSFYEIVALVTDCLFIMFLGRKLQCSLLPVEALQVNCGVRFVLYLLFSLLCYRTERLEKQKNPIRS